MWADGGGRRCRQNAETVSERASDQTLRVEPGDERQTDGSSAPPRHVVSCLRRAFASSVARTHAPCTLHQVRVPCCTHARINRTPRLLFISPTATNSIGDNAMLLSSVFRIIRYETPPFRLAESVSWCSIHSFIHSFIVSLIMPLDKTQWITRRNTNMRHEVMRKGGESS